MDETPKLPDGKSTLTKNTDVFESFCWNCERETMHIQLVAVSKSTYEEDYDVNVTSSHQILQCRGCEKNSFRELWWTSEDDAHGPSENLYPGKTRVRDAMPEAKYIPRTIKNAYDETRQAMGSNMPILAIIGIRTIIDAVCRHEKTTEGAGLGARLNELHRRGDLPKVEADLLQRTKGLGNQGAHEGEVVDRDVFEAAFDVVEHLLKRLYILPKIGLVIPEEKARPKKGKSPPLNE